MSTSKFAGALLALILAIFASPAVAAERTESDFVKACSAKKAKAELTPGGYSLLVAMLEGNDAAAAQLRSKLPVEQVMKAGTFMTRGPAQCAKESPASD